MFTIEEIEHLEYIEQQKHTEMMKAKGEWLKASNELKMAKLQNMKCKSAQQKRNEMRNIMHPIQ